MQRHTLSVTRIQSHKGFTAHDLCWVARKSIPKLEHRIGSDRVEVVITVDKACPRRTRPPSVRPGQDMPSREQFRKNKNYTLRS
jgi:hypothetical protein